MRINLKKMIIYWLPVIVWGFIIFGFSSQPYEQQDLRPLIEKHIDEEAAEKLLHRFTITYHGKEISIDSLGVAGFIEFFIRKGAHLFEYAVLGILLFRAIQSSGISRGRALTLSLLLSFLYAASDEWHQSFTMNRTPLFTDVLIDSVGALVGIVIALIFYKRKYQKENSSF